MRITVDTNTDHPDEIQKAIQLLAQLASRKREQPELYSNASNSSVNQSSAINEIPTPTSSAESLINDVKQEKVQEEAEVKKEVPDTPPDFSSFINLMDNNDKTTESKKFEPAQEQKKKGEGKEATITIF
jgi:hypothetical protein